MKDDLLQLEDLEPVPSLGTVVETGRGHLPFALLHGEALIACASWALGEAGVTQVDTGTPWGAVAAAEEPFVLHDPLCPMTPAHFVALCVRTCVERGAVVVGARPVTDTVREVDADGALGEVVDRDALVVVTSPVVLPPVVVEALDGLPTDDFERLVPALAERFPVVVLTAPPEGRRVVDEDDVRVLEVLTAPTR